MKTVLQKPSLMYFLPILLPIFFIADIAYGTVSIPFQEVIHVLLGGVSEKKSWEIIIWQFRLPKTLTAILVGSGLSVCGLQMQTLFRNPLADAYTLGISSGASLGVALLILGGVGFAHFLGQWAIVISAIVGALGIMAIILLITNYIQQMVSLLIVGLMLGNGVAAFIIILQSFSGKEELQRFAYWTYGTLSAVDWEKMKVFLPMVLIGVFLSMFFYKSLNILVLGDNYAKSLGLNIKQTRWKIILLNSILTGSITAFCGIIGFVGIAVPHLSRYLLGTNNHKLLLPVSALLGALLMLVCDMLCQIPNSPHVLPINAITALVGVPVVVWVIMQRRYK
ncbi:MAG: iron ABC transporter permease [Thermoflexibacter sp.]|nr:iron ABC transporter permease [Thermoflexibacter sp.]